MAKSIRYIAPVESMSGNLSGNQRKLYAENNNPAWDAPNGTQYAKSYKPRFVGREIARTGKVTFSVKTKTATKLDAASRRRMAAMAYSQRFMQPNGGAWPLSVITDAQLLFDAARERDTTLTWRKFFSKPIYEMLKNRAQTVTFYGLVYGRPNVVVGNPFYPGPSTAPKFTLQPDDPNLTKFWQQLAVNGREFTVEGATGVFFAGMSFQQLVLDTTNINVLGLEAVTISPDDPGTQGIQLNGKWLAHVVEEAVVCVDPDDIIAEENYILVDEWIS